MLFTVLSISLLYFASGLGLRDKWDPGAEPSNSTSASVEWSVIKLDIIAYSVESGMRLAGELLGYWKSKVHDAKKVANAMDEPQAGIPLVPMAVDVLVGTLVFVDSNSPEELAEARRLIYLSGGNFARKWTIDGPDVYVAGESGEAVHREEAVAAGMMVQTYQWLRALGEQVVEEV